MSWIQILRVAFAGGLLLALVACGAPGASGPQIRIVDPWARPAMSGGMSMGEGHGGHGGAATSAVYFVVRNEGDQPDALIGAATDVAETVELHETRMEGDMAKMVPVPRVEIPARGQVEFRPRGLHVMLIGLRRDLKVGDTFTLTLRFEKSGEKSVTVTVKEMNP
ncbi:copper chaperone PCu(A)C [Thermoflexus sp.]|uniref:copper chaperone PCu(A)C n=1 Tax=Thermoflexus sp. TaxID=1969742 RepID=UPI002605A91E|nr:copper chaperone PCu(A)C [Thermoflexus sp.]MDT7947976.1 copper chaperone PCu(A)C [Thermoflexus sp.]